MAEITASLVKELRERTGAGMMDCKKALTEAKCCGSLFTGVDHRLDGRRSSLDFEYDVGLRQIVVQYEALHGSRGRCPWPQYSRTTEKPSASTKFLGSPRPWCMS